MAKDLPRLSTPKVQIATDESTHQNLFTVDFNGSGLDPLLVLSETDQVPLEKTSDRSGFILSLVKPDSEKSFSLRFEIKNANGEYIQYILQIDESQAFFHEILSDDQARRICIKNQFWIGMGLSVLSYDQKVQDLDASSKFSAVTPGSSHVDFRYYLNSQWGFLGTYKTAPGKIKTDSNSTLSSPNFNRKIFEVAFQWRSYGWMTQWKNMLFYPYLRGGYQMHEIPRIFIDDAGGSTLGSFRMNQAALGAGLNIFDRNKMFYEIYMNWKQPLNSEGQTITPGLHFDGAMGLGRSFGRSFAVGAFWHGHYDKFKYSTQQNGFENKGDTTLIFSNLDLKLGWIF